MQQPDYFQSNGWNLYASGPSNELWLHHMPRGEQSQFVARFKYAKTASKCRAFARFLTRNFTPAEYFAAYATGKSPMAILESKGYVDPLVAKLRQEAARQLHVAMGSLIIVPKGAAKP
jgi:hypothetical protein